MGSDGLIKETKHDNNINPIVELKWWKTSTKWKQRRW